MDQNQSLAKLAAYKEFLKKNDFPENLPNYDQQSYWDARYQIEQQEIYDWYFEPQQIKELFCEFLSPQMKILELGSGKSKMLDSLMKWGFKDLIASDFSWNLILQKKNEEKYLKRGIRWERIDATKEWPNFEINCIFEKATLDCLSSRNLKKSLEIIYQMLPKKGIFIHISCWKPQNRIKLLKNWNVQVYQVPKVLIPAFVEIDDSPSYFAYVCSK